MQSSIQQNLVNLKFKGPKKVSGIMKNLYNSIFLIANNLLEKLVLLPSM
jgi:hypothetical protein